MSPPPLHLPDPALPPPVPIDQLHHSALPDPTCRREPKRAASHQRREWPSTYIVNMTGIFVDICKHNVALFINNIIAK